jgi:CTP synthase
MEVGINPYFIFARSDKKLSNEAKKKISLFCNVCEENIISAHNSKDIYNIPINFIEQNLDESLLKFFNLIGEKANLNEWKELTSRKEQAREKIKIAVIGKYSKLKDAYVSIEQSFKHCEYAIPGIIELEWIEAEDIEKYNLEDYSGVLVPGGFGNRGVEEKISAIRIAREKNIPFLGLCLGFQLATIEFARNILNLDANSTEFDEDTKNPVIHLLPNQNLENMGATMRLGEKICLIKGGTLAEKIYNNSEIKERHRHRYEFNNAYIKKFQDAEVIFSGISKEDLMEIFELPQSKHKFFIATQFHPEFTSRLENPSPIFLEFSKVCFEHEKSKNNI